MHSGKAEVLTLTIPIDDNLVKKFPGPIGREGLQEGLRLGTREPQEEELGMGSLFLKKYHLILNFGSVVGEKMGLVSL